MNQYGAGQNVPYSGQQEAGDLVNNPRYTGQAAGTNPLGHDGRGPAEESRYGAAPLSTNAGTNTGLGAQNVWPSPAAPPHAYRSDLAGVDQYGNPRREGVMDRMKDAVGMGPNSGTTGYGTRRDEYGNPQREGMEDKMKDAVGVGLNSGTTGYDARRDQLGYGTPGYDNYGQPRREGMADRMEDVVGVGPNSGATGYDARRSQPGYGTPGYDNYGQPMREGMVDRMEDAVGVGPHSGTRGPYTGEDYTNVNRPSGETGFGGGLGHSTGTTAGTTTGFDQPGLGSGLGTHHHDHQHDGVNVVPGTIPVVGMGERRVEPGYDASRGQFGQHHQGTMAPSPRKEGIVEKIKDAVGMGSHDNVAHTHPGTTTGTILPNTYGTGESGLGSHGNTTSTYGSTPGVGLGTHHDNVSSNPGATAGTILPNTYGAGETGLGHHHNTPTPGSYSHNSMVDTGLGHERHPGSSTGYPHETVGDRAKDAVGVPHRDAAGYPHNTDAAYPGSATDYPHETMGDRAKDALGVGPHHGVTGTDYDYERRGKGFEDTPDVMHDTKTGPGFDATNVDHPRTGAETGYDDSAAYGVDSAPPKKGIMTKIKEKLHQ